MKVPQNKKYNPQLEIFENNPKLFVGDRNISSEFTLSENIYLGKIRDRLRRPKILYMNSQNRTSSIRGLQSIVSITTDNLMDLEYGLSGNYVILQAKNKDSPTLKKENFLILGKKETSHPKLISEIIASNKTILTQYEYVRGLPLSFEEEIGLEHEKVLKYKFEFFDYGQYMVKLKSPKYLELRLKSINLPEDFSKKITPKEEKR